MSTMRTLYECLGELAGVSRRRIELFGRHLREAGHIETGRPGRGDGTPEATPKSAAALLIGVLAGDSAVGAADAFTKIGSLNCEEIQASDFATPLVPPAGTVFDALAYILEKMGDRSAGNPWRELVSEVAFGSIQGESGAWISVKLDKDKKDLTRRYILSGASRHSPKGLARIGSLDGDSLVEIADLLRGHESGPTSGSGSPEKEA